MKNQTTIFDNQVKIEPLNFAVPKTIRIPIGESQEFVTKSGKVCIVEHRKEILSGVGKTDFYKISHEGRVYGPASSKEVKKFLMMH